MGVYIYIPAKSRGHIAHTYQHKKHTCKQKLAVILRCDMRGEKGGVNKKGGLYVLCIYTYIHTYQQKLAVIARCNALNGLGFRV
jgi:hypothetical protein